MRVTLRARKGEELSRYHLQHHQLNGGTRQHPQDPPHCCSCLHTGTRSSSEEGYERQHCDRDMCSCCLGQKQFANMHKHNCNKVVETINNGDYNEINVAGDLPAKLETHSFNGAVSEAVRKCYNNSDCDPQKCKLAAAAIILQDSTTNFIAAYGGSATAQTSCTTPTSSFTDEEVQQILCNASVYIMKLLQNVDKDRGPYYNSCKA